MSRSPIMKQEKKSWGYSFAFGFLVATFVTFVFVAGVFVITREQYGKISTIELQGLENIDEAGVISAVHDFFKQECFLFAPCGYSFWLPEDDLIHYIKTVYPRIANVKIINSTRSGIVIQLSERHLSYRFCDNRIGGVCYLVDNEGVAFSISPPISDLRDIPTVRLDDSLQVQNTIRPPERVFDSELLHEIEEVSTIMEPFGRIYELTISKRDINAEVDKLFGYSIANDTAIIKFNRKTLTDENATEYVRAGLDRIQTFNPFIESYNSNPNSLEYLDIRFPKRIYMKFASADKEVDIGDAVEQ